MDFNLRNYKNLFEFILSSNYSFNTFIDYLNKGDIKRITILRHDVDLLPFNSVTTAIIENELGIKGSYYFRMIPQSYNLKAVNKIASLGHEIGYHYEDIDLAVQKFKQSGIKNYTTEDLIEEGYKIFCENLAFLRKNFDIKTICMHGSPRSKYDNKLLWTKYNYKDLGIVGEPYYDIDFNKFAYFTDTGRRWNGSNVSVRDKVNSKYNYNFKTTQQIIENIDNYLII